jgi:hypothetical protein
MLSITADALAAGIVPFFFVSFAIIWLSFWIVDLFKKK